jgi:hypothetical protein
MMVVMVEVRMHLVVWAVPHGGRVEALLLLLVCPPAGFCPLSATCRVVIAATCEDTGVQRVVSKSMRQHRRVTTQCASCPSQCQADRL